MPVIPENFVSFAEARRFARFQDNIDIGWAHVQAWRTWIARRPLIDPREDEVVF